MRAVLALALAAACAPAPAETVLDAAAFQRAELHPAAGRLAGASGWAEYDFGVARAGWHELVAVPGGREISYSIRHTGRTVFSVYDSTGNVQQGEDKVSSVWLPAGPHTLRVERRYWTGFPAVQRFVLRPIASGMRASLTGATRVFRARACASIEVEASAPVDVFVRAPGSGPRRLRRLQADSPSRPWRLRFDPPCDREGDHLVSFGTAVGEMSWREQRPIAYEVIDTAVAPAVAPARRTLVDEVRFASREPDYAGGATRVVDGRYRESGDSGFTRYQRAPPAARVAMREPSWFAYVLRNIAPQEPHVVEIDYPDDALRTMVFALRESAPLAYPVSAGVDSGGEFPLTRRTQTHSLLYWPRAADTRLVVLNAHDDRRAAAARARVYRIDRLPALEVREGGRRFLNYFEEGSNFVSLYGARDPSSAAGRREALERWARAARHMGIDTLMPTVSVYSFVLYPSALQGAFAKPDGEDLRRLLLVAEKHSLKVIPELHPRGDDLERSHAGSSDHLLVSKDGKTSVGRVPPLRNALHPRTREWYLGVVEELARLHADSPAFAGVSLRHMSWANPGLADLESLDWGYDPGTLAAFERDTGLRPERARERWIAWRVERITELHAQALARLRAVRADLQLVAPLFRRDGAASQAGAWREAGVDPAALARLPGLVLLNAQVLYGRREADPLVNRRNRELLVDPTRLSWMKAAGFLSIADYVEITEAVATPASLGFAPNTPLTWTSAAVTPAGRHFLERYALQLADTDAFVLGDGGNGYSMGQPVLREWVREFRSLPARAFVPHPQARAPVALWTRDEPGALLAYAVNRASKPATLEIEFSGPGGWRRLAGGDALEARGGRLAVTLEPYAVIALRAAKGTTIRQPHTR